MTAMHDLPRTVALANRVLAHEGVLDAFGHVSARDPADPDRFFLARSLAPELVTPQDVLAFDLDAQPVEPTAAGLYSERVIHAAIYRARPDVNAICHHHAPAVMPFCLGGLRLRVVTQLGAVIGPQVPLWDQRTEFGATNHLVQTAADAASLARCLGAAPLVLMKRHGATVVGRDVAELAFRAIYSCRDADIQLRALAHGAIDVFTDEEIALAGKYPPTSLSRAWALWCSRLEAAGRAP